MLKKIALWLAAAAVIGGVIGITALNELNFTIDGNHYSFKEIVSGDAENKNKVVINETKTMPAQDVESLKINTVSENVEVIYEKRSDILVTFTGEATIPKGSTTPKLIVNQVSKQLNVSIESFNLLNVFNLIYDTKVVVSLPETSKVELNIGTVSGNVRGEAFKAADINTVSGNVDLKSHDQGKNILKTTSGNLLLEGDPGHVTLGSVSGDVEAKLNTLSGDLEAGTTSGSCRIQLNSADQGFIYKGSSVSGNLRLTGFGTDVDEEQSIQTTVGAGKYNIHLESVSGDLSVEKK